MIRLLAIFFLLISGMANAAEINFYGDILLSRGIEKLSDAEGQRSLINHINHFTSMNAIHVANLEGAVGDKSFCATNHNPCFPIKKKNIDILSDFDVISLENNHSLDLGLTGLNNTIEELQKRQIHYLGGNNYSVIIETENGNMGIMGITDVVNSKSDKKHLIMADTPQVLEEIKRLKKICTLVAVYIHWGRELDNLPTQRMRTLAQEIIEAGADIIVGTHPHVVGKIECVQNKPVVYSLGNFLFDQKYEETKKGAILNCAIIKTGFLKCKLIGTETPANSFLPRLAKIASYPKENSVLSACQPFVQQTWTGAFSSDKRKKRLLLKTDEKNKSLLYLELYDLKTGAREIKTPPMPIVKLQPIDINNDGIIEIMLIQNVYSSLDNEVAKRVYIYSFDQNFHALWRGSALSRPLLDAILIKPENNKPILVALHTADSFLIRNPSTPRRIIMSYRWNGFGFSGIKELKSEKSSTSLSFIRGEIKFIDENNTAVQKIPAQSFY
ncbi:MAG: CapA family protein [Syntrophaceae bacterium]|nr:CapA family protein [Syntrophaceae bacterium]